MRSDGRPTTHPTIDPLDPTTWPATCPKCGVDLKRVRQCMGHSKRAPHKHCGDVAAEGQVVCRRHGALAPKSMAAADRRLQRAQLDTDLGQLLEILEMQAAERPVVDVLLDAVHRCAAMVQVLGALLGGVDVDRLPKHALVELYGLWLERAAKAASLAVRAGVEERKVQLVEQQAQLLATVIRGVVEDLGHDLQDARVRAVVTGRLQLVRGEAA